MAKYTADDIKKIYEQSLPKITKAPYQNPQIVNKEDIKLPSKEPEGLIDNITQPFKNIQSNFTAGDLTENESKAWSIYRAKQNAESLKAAQQATIDRENYSRNNQNVGQGNIITKDFAQYLPQMKNQILSGISGAGDRALMGAGVGASAALIAGQVGPQVLAPEEMVTVPIGATLGAVKGGQAGYMEGVAKYSYNQMAGSAYKGLLDLGVPNEIALKVSADEALVSSLIEAAGAGIDIATVGIGKLFSKGAKTATEKVVKNKLLSALKAYGINIASEATEEGLQEAVSIASEKKALTQANIPRQATKEQDIQRIIEAAKGGAAIATVSGGVNAIGNYATNKINDKQINNTLPTKSQTNKVKIEDIIKNNKEVAQEVNTTQATLPTANETNTNNPVEVELTNEDLIGNLFEELGKDNPDPEAVKNIINNKNFEDRQGFIDSEANPFPDYDYNEGLVELKNNNKTQNAFNIPDGLTYDEYDSLMEKEDVRLQEKYGFEKWYNNFIGRENDIPKEEYAYSNALMEKRDAIGQQDDNAAVENVMSQLDKVEAKSLEWSASENSIRNFLTDLTKSQYYPFNEANPIDENDLRKQLYNYLIQDIEDAPEELRGEYKRAREIANGQRQNNFGKSLNTLFKQIDDVVDVLVGKKETNNKFTNYEKIKNKNKAVTEPTTNVNTQVKQIVDNGINAPQTVNNNVVQGNELPTLKQQNLGIQQDQDSEILRTNDNKTYSTLDRLGKSVGVKIKVVQSDKKSNGYYDAKTNTLQIALDSQNPFMTVAKHEFTHKLQIVAPELYQKYKSFILDTMKKNGTYKDKFDNLVKLYEDHEEQYDNNLIEDELVARAAEDLFKDRDTIAEMVNYDPTLAEKIVAIIKDVINKIKKVTNENDLTLRELQKAEKLWSEMLNSAIKDNTQAETMTQAESEQEFYNNDGIKFSIRTKEPPKKSTFKAYKLLRIDKDGKLYPLFVGANEETIQGVWLDADDNQSVTDHKGNKRVLGKVGSKTLLSDGTSKTTLAYRPGWHLGDIPLATHIGLKGKSGKIEFMKPDHVWVECDIAEDINYQSQANERGYRTYSKDKGYSPSKKLNAKFADLDFIPVDGYYRYKTNPNMTGEWIITGSMKINRILSDEEAAKIVRDAGYEPLPRKLNDKKYSLKDSNGNTLSKEQQEYFKDSKVKDEIGNLLLVYHGTKNNFNEFIPSKGGEFGSGIYLTDNKDTAMWYAKYVSRGDGEPNAIEAYVNISNPYVINKEDYIKKTEKITPNTLKNRLIKQGYDGIIGIGINGYEKQYIAFESSQVKNTSNVNPTSDPDIRYSLKEIKDKYKADTDVLEVYETKNKISLDNIEVKKESRNKGIGSNFMKDLIEYADKENKTIVLTPTNKYQTQNKLVKWYKTFGFVENKGRNTNFEYRDTMYRKPANGDVKFSLKEKENDTNAVRRLGKELNKIYNSKYDELENKLLELYKSVETDEALKQAKDIAKMMIESSKVINNEMYNEYSQLRKTLRETEITVSDKDKGNFKVAGGYNEFRKRNFGRLNLTKDGMFIDKFYQELADTYPELFSKEIADPADQAMRISEVLDGLKAEEVNPYANNQAEAIDELTNEIIKNLKLIKDKAEKFVKPQNKEIKNVKKNNNKLPKASQLTILLDAEERLNQAQSNNASDKRIANVLTSSKPNKLPVKSQLTNIKDAFNRKFVDSGNTIATVAKLIKDSTLYTMYNNARQARQAAEFMLTEAQTDVLGKNVGKSLIKIFEPIRRKGDDYYRSFSEYMYHKHNISRMAQEKPVFGDSITADVSRAKVAEYELSNPEFVDYANEIYNYNRNLMQYRVDTGLISEKQAIIMNSIYPFYVPTYRDVSGIAGSSARGNTVEIKQGIKKATGSSRDLLPLHEQMARMTMQVVQAGKRNMFGNRLLSDVLANKDKLRDYIQSVETNKVEDQIDIDELDVMEMPELNNTFIVYNDGQKIAMRVNAGVFEAVKIISSQGREVTGIELGAKWLNSVFKKMITSYSPLFTIRNIARDIQDAGLYSKDLNAFIKSYPKAMAEIKNNGELWQTYQALGGFGSSIFDYERGYLLKERKKALTKAAGAVLDKIEDINFVTEQLPRFAEFMATVEKGDGSYENLMEAMYNAADITVNFGRSGTWGRVLNTTFVPFFNPSVQGIDKLIRTFTEAKGAKAWTSLVIKSVALGVLPSVLNALLYDDDDEYDKLNDRDKDTNFLFKVNKDQWLKIPKGRVLSLFGNAAQRTLRSAKGEKDAWAEFLSTTADSVAPVNPFTENIVAPLILAANNKTWYGTPIENQSLQNVKPADRYDENTDSFSIMLGKALNYSPKKINYLLDSYSGVIGDFVLPMMTKKAESNPVTKAFVIDSTLSNKISKNFYNAFEEVKYVKNSAEGDNVEDVVYRFMNKQSQAVSDLSKEMRAIENGNLKDDEKRVKVKEIKATINALEQNALDTIEKYKQAAAKNFSKFNDVDDAYLYTNREVFGAEYAIRVYNKKTYEKYLKSGKSAEKFFKEEFEGASEDGKIKLPTIKTTTSNVKLPTIKNK